MNDRSCGDLRQWLERSGAQLPLVAVAEDDNGEREVRAVESIAAGAEVLAIPLSLIMTERTAWQSTVGRAIAASGVQLRSTQSVLAAFLLQEREAPDSFWTPYLDSLPRAFPHVPLFFDGAELALLEGSLASEMIETRHRALADEYGLLCAGVPAFRRHSLRDFVWARVAVITRAFAVRVAGDLMDALVPIGDLLNHRRPRETTWAIDDERGRFVMTSLRSFAAGESIHDSYGIKCNGRFFVNYGFCLSDNSANEAVLRFDETTPGWSGDPRAFRVRAEVDDQARELFDRLRQLDGAAVCWVLTAACEQALRRFPTTLAEDETILGRPGLSINARNAVLMRRGEKRVLHFFRELASARAATGL